MFRSVSAHPLTSALFALHAALLESVRREHEREHGRVASSGELLQLVAFEPAFAWLSPLSRAIDAWQQEQEGAELELARLFTAESAFRARLLEQLQREPDVVWAYAQLRRHLTAPTAARVDAAAS